MKTIVSKLRPVRRAQGGAWSKIGDQPLSADLLRRMGQALVRAFADEASRAFAMRGWSMKSMDGGKPINRSFSFRIVGDSTVEVLSSFPGLPELVQGIAPRAMTWLTQEAKDKNPADYELTPRERKLGMKKTGKVSKHERLPLVVPLRSKGGSVVFRMAPLTIGSAWIHPGIARFTFAQRAAKKARAEFERLLIEEVQKRLVEGDPSR